MSYVVRVAQAIFIDCFLRLLTSYIFAAEPLELYGHIFSLLPTHRVHARFLSVKIASKRARFDVNIFYHQNLFIIYRLASTLGSLRHLRSQAAHSVE